MDISEKLRDLYNQIKLPTINNWNTYIVENKAICVKTFGFFVDVSDPTEEMITFISNNDNRQYESLLKDNFNKYMDMSLKYRLPDYPSTLSESFLIICRICVRETILPHFDKLLSIEPEMHQKQSNISYFGYKGILERNKNWFLNLLEFLSLLIDNPKMRGAWSKKLRSIVYTYNLMFMFNEDSTITFYMPFMLPSLNITKHLHVFGRIPEQTETLITSEHFYGEWGNLLITNGVQINDVVVRNGESFFITDNVSENFYPYDKRPLWSSSTETIFGTKTVDSELNQPSTNDFDTIEIYFKSTTISELLDESIQTDKFVLIVNDLTGEIEELKTFDTGILLNENYFVFTDSFISYVTNEDLLIKSYVNENATEVIVSLSDMDRNNMTSKQPKDIDLIKASVLTMDIGKRKFITKLGDGHNTPLIKPYPMISPELIVIINPFEFDNPKSIIKQYDEAYGFATIGENIQANLKLQQELATLNINI